MMAAPASLALAGCAHDTNMRLELGVNHRTPTFASASGEIPLAGPARERSSWARTVVVSPIDGVRHSPSPRPLDVVSHRTPPREYGLYPTPESAVTLDPDPGVVAVVSPVAETGASVLSWINPLFDVWSGDKPWSPQRVWKRTPASEAWYSGSSLDASAGDDTDG